MMIEYIIPDKSTCDISEFTPHEFYYQLRRYEHFKKLKRKDRWTKDFLKKFEERWNWIRN